MCNCEWLNDCNFRCKGLYMCVCVCCGEKWKLRMVGGNTKMHGSLFNLLHIHTRVSQTNPKRTMNLFSINITFIYIYMTVSCIQFFSLIN